MKKKLNFTDYKNMNLMELVEVCKKLEIAINGNKSSVLYEILKYHIGKNDEIVFEGCLEMVNNSYGFLRDINNNFIQTPYDVYLNPRIIKENNLRCGDFVSCYVGLPKTEDQKLCSVIEILKVNGEDTKKLKQRLSFEDFTAIYPKEQIILENIALSKNYNTACRILDLISPIALGQRALIAAPPKCGKTTFLYSIVSSILISNSKIKLIIVLVGERPEEVTEMKKIAPFAEIVSSTFDESAENQIRTTEIINERAKRLVEMGFDVVMLLDSETRLVRAYNYALPSSGKVLTGGVDSLALIRPKKFFGSARNTEEGGSLTIIATALIETGSKMDDFIFEELKGTGNSEIMLSREIAEKRIFPAIHISKSGTRRSDVFIDKNKLQKIQLLEAFLSNMDDQSEAIKLLIDRISINPGNRELLINLQN